MEHQHGRRVFVLYPNIAAVTSCEKDLFGGNKNFPQQWRIQGEEEGPRPSLATSYHTRQTEEFFSFLVAICRVIAETVTTKDSHVYRYSLVCNLSDMNLSN